MTDVFVLVADSDAAALLGAVLKRTPTLGIRQISFNIRRINGRDPGMVKEGPELARMLAKKDEFSKLVLVWDHQGSGWNERMPADAARRIQDRLDGTTWSHPVSSYRAGPRTGGMDLAASS